ncbi:LysR substrate-binding domain-containing protein, partial [Paracoccus sp. (in: a-proteobacteria)]|uniref:LysR family transcriptional regulator n=1 Tax=Paracoccus sp. TaxID=267 RepID=UPI003A8903C2
RDLEDHLGAGLFHRHSGGIRLTFAGARYLPRARQILRGLHQGSREIAEIGQAKQGRVRIGLYGSIASGFLAELLQAYGQHHPSVQIELVDADPADHIVAIGQFRLDVAFLHALQDWPDYDTIPLWSERIFMALPEAHHLADRANLDWRDLAAETFIVREAASGQEIQDHLAHIFARFDRRPVFRIQSVGRANLLPLVALGQGIAIVSEAMVATRFPGLIYRPINGELLSFSAVWSPKNDNPAFRRLLSMAKTMAAQQAVNGGDTGIVNPKQGPPLPSQ